MNNTKKLGTLGVCGGGVDAPAANVLALAYQQSNREKCQVIMAALHTCLSLIVRHESSNEYQSAHESATSVLFLNKSYASYLVTMKLS